MRADRVPASLRLVALREEALQDLRQDARLAAEEGAVGGADEGGTLLRPGLGDVPQGIDVEGADETRVQALEVERQDVLEQTGDRLENRAPQDHVLRGGCSGAHARRHVTAPSQLVQVEKIERRDARSDPIQGHAGQQASPDRQVQEARLVQDRQDQARVGEVVLDEQRQVVAEGAFDRLGPLAPRHPVVRVAERDLPFPQDGARGGVEAVVVQLHERRAHEIDAVEDDAAGDVGARSPPEGPLPDHAGRPGRPADLERDSQGAGARQQNVEIEIDHVPPGQNVEIDLPQTGEQVLQQGALVAARHDPARSGRLPQALFDLLVGESEEDLLHTGPGDGRGVDPRGARVGLQVDRHEPEPFRLRAELRRTHGRFVEAHVHAARRGRRAAAGSASVASSVDLKCAAYAVIDEVAHGEADVRLEHRQPGLHESVAQGRHAIGEIDFDPHDRLSAHGLQRSRRLAGRAVRPGGLPVRRPHEEVRDEAAVAHEERPAVREPAEQVDDRSSVLQPVGRMDDEALQGLTRHVLPSGHDTRSGPACLP